MIWYVANQIYRPSYISLHTALSFYGLIPESVVQITSVTSLKTATFTNSMGEYSYKSMKEGLMFGYQLKPITDNLTIRFATPEKAILDLLYLYPFYNSVQELEELRLDEDYLSSTPYIRNMVFIGGTNLRLVKGIDRFSEDLDFDCKDFSNEEFMEMTHGIVQFL